MTDSSDSIDYGTLMNDAMRDLVRRVLQGVAKTGLPGDHHFFINFDTQDPKVEIADWMKDRFPEDMTVVMQHWFDGLWVTEEGFAVTLNFGDTPEPLYIPFEAINTFVDPSVEFGLRFEMPEEHGPELHIAGEDDLDIHPMSQEESPIEDPEHGNGHTADEAPAKEAEVVSLDSFRK